MNNFSSSVLAKMIDHTLLKPNASLDDYKRLCEECITYGFKSICVNSSAIKTCKTYLDGHDLTICSVVGFPLGQSSIETKVFETKDAIEKGAKEIDYVINITELKAGNVEYIQKEMSDILSVCKNSSVVLKVIIETCFLTEGEKKLICEIASRIKPDFVKTSTGFGTYGATIEDVKLMKKYSGADVKVKASGGIKDLKTALNMILAGAERLGTSSGVSIMQELTDTVEIHKMLDHLNKVTTNT